MSMSARLCRSLHRRPPVIGLALLAWATATLTGDCDLDIGRQLGADQVRMAWVNRVSGLIRADNDTAWTREIVYRAAETLYPWSQLYITLLKSR